MIYKNIALLSLKSRTKQRCSLLPLIFNNGEGGNSFNNYHWITNFVLNICPLIPTALRKVLDGAGLLDSVIPGKLE